MKRSVLAVLIAISCCGCAAMAYSSYMDDSGARALTQADRAFVASYRQTQVLRQELGRPLLDWCSECYRYDRKWALEDMRCTARIKRYEAGDSTALNRPGVGVDSVNGYTSPR